MLQMKRVADFKEKHKAILTNLVPDDEKQALTEENVVNVLKDRDHKGRRVLIVNSGGLYQYFLKWLYLMIYFLIKSENAKSTRYI